MIFSIVKMNLAGTGLIWSGWVQLFTQKITRNHLL